MIDHIQRIVEEQRIDEMDRKSAPLAITFVIVLAVILVDLVLNAYADHKYADHIRIESLYVSALNGVPVDTGDGIATCKVEKFNLVEGIK